MAISATALCCATAANAARYVLNDLGTLGGAVSYADAVNASGEAAGNSQTAALPGYNTAFRHSGGVMKNLGPPADPPFETFGEGINDNGQVVGVAFTPAADRAVIYDAGGLVDLGTLGGLESGAFAINNSGQITGFAQTGVTSLSAAAFLYGA